MGPAVIVGSGGGIGRALAEALVVRRPGSVYALSRAARVVEGAEAVWADVTDEASLKAAARSIGSTVQQVWVATGVLEGEHARPERRVSEITAAGLAEAFAVNTTGPALVAKHFTPLLPRDGPALFAVLSARVGSIGDNRLGGWCAYRASKSALNMLVRCLAIELARTHPLTVCVALHPGTVDTPLSRPFQRGVKPDHLFSPEVAARQLLDTAERLTPGQSGGFFAYDGSMIPY